jgi:tetratricopeptide (TPR) repeat protein
MQNLFLLKILILVIASVPISSLAQRHLGCEIVRPEVNSAAFNSAQRIIGLISNSLYDQVEQELSAKYKKYQVNEYNDIFLQAEIVNAATSSTQTEASINKWINSRSNSFWANIIKAEYHSNQFLKFRRMSMADPTNKALSIQADEEYAVSAQYFDKSISLDKSIAFSYAGYMNIIRPVKGNVVALANAEKGLDSDKKSHTIRRAILTTLSPQWGGSFEAMDSFVKKTEEYKLPRSTMDWLNYISEMRKAEYFEESIKDSKSAIKHYRQALVSCPEGYLALNGGARSAFRIKDWPQSIELYTKLINEYPNSNHAYGLRGFAFESISKTQEAVKDFLKGNEMGDGYAAFRLGLFYLSGLNGFNKDINKARQLLEYSANQGNQDAKRALTELDLTNKVR